MAEKRYMVAAFCSDLNEDNEFDTDWVEYTEDAVVGELVGMLVARILEHKFTLEKYDISVTFKEFDGSVIRVGGYGNG